MRRGGGYILRFYFNIYIEREVYLLVLIGNSTSAFKVGVVLIPNPNDC